MKFVWYVKSGELVDVKAALGLAEVHFVVKLTISNFAVLIIFKPLYSLAFFPEAKLGRLTWHVIGAETMLLTTAPVSGVGSAIRPSIDAVSVLLVIFVLTSILSAILPGVHADAIHIIIDPFSLVLTAIEPCVCSQSFDFILLPFAIVPRTIVPAIDSAAVLLAREVLSFIH